MKRIILMVIRSIFNLQFWMIRLYRLGNAEKYNAENRYAFLHRVTPIAIRRGRIKILCTGLENLPRETGYVIFPNHQGMFDVLALSRHMKDHLLQS